MRLRVGFLGLGTVGGSAAAMIERHAARWQRQRGVELCWQRALVRDLRKPRLVQRPERLTRDPAAVIEAGDVDVVVEAMGGVDPSGQCVLRALRAGKHVVTANKALLAERWESLHATAGACGVQLGYEAAVAAAIPCLTAFDSVLAAALPLRVEACLNGTCNYVLHRMESTGAPLAEALRQAQVLGYAEPDPGDDVSGRDVARKATVLSRLAFARAPAEVACTGIEGLEPDDLVRARQNGKRLRLVARLQAAEASGGNTGGGAPSLTVAPDALPEAHPLARLVGPENGLVVEAEPLDRLFFSGPGAGGPASASAVLGDVLAVAAGRRLRGREALVKTA